MQEHAQKQLTLSKKDHTDECFKTQRMASKAIHPAHVVNGTRGVQVLVRLEERNVKKSCRSLSLHKQFSSSVRTRLCQVALALSMQPPHLIQR